MIEPLQSGWLYDRLRGFAGRTCLVSGGRRYTYTRLIAAVDESRGEFERQGVHPGALVRLRADYSLGGIAALVALYQIAAIVAPAIEAGQNKPEGGVPFDWEVSAGDVLECRRAAQPTVDGAPGLVEDLRAAGRTGLILLTSGSTGRPKAMLHDFGELLERYRDRRPAAVRMLLVLRFDHIGGLNTLLHGLCSGATLVHPPSLKPEAIAQSIESERIQVLPASPSFLNLLLMSDAWQNRNLKSLRLVTYGTEAMPAALLRRLRMRFPNVRFAQAYGSTETGIMQTAGKSSDSLLLRFSGPPGAFRVVDGELWIRTGRQALGYLSGHDSALTADGWFRTGDIVEQTDDGYLRILGRTDDIINVAGQKVYPLEVESALLEMPEILACRVASEPHPLTGQIVTATITCAGRADPEAIRARVRRHCRARLAAHMLPAKLHITPVAALEGSGPGGEDERKAPV